MLLQIENVGKFSLTKILGTLAKGKEILGHQNTIKKIYAEVTAEKKNPTS